MTARVTRQRLAELMREALARGWEVCPGPAPSVRARRTLDTPEWARRDRTVRGMVFPARWPVDTYDALVFVTFHPGWRDARPIIGVADSPGGGRRDQCVSLRRAAEILAAPSLVAPVFEGWLPSGVDTPEGRG